MKRLIAIGLIFILSGQCLFKLGLITYFKLNQDYIAAVLCINKDKPITMCNGKCFLDKNLVLAEETEKAPVANTKDKVEIPVFMVSTNVYQFDPGVRLITYTTAYTKEPFAGYKTTVYHPPSFLS